MHHQGLDTAWTEIGRSGYGKDKPYGCIIWIGRVYSTSLMQWEGKKGPEVPQSLPSSKLVSNFSCILCICNNLRSTRGGFNLKRVETCTVCLPLHHLASGDILYKFSMPTAYSEGKKEVSHSVKILGSSHSIFKGLQCNLDLLRSSEYTTFFIDYRNW